MTPSNRTDVFWRVFSIVLLVVLVGLVAVIYWQGQQPRHVYYETADHPPKSELVSLAPSLNLDHDSIYWIADLAEKSLPFVVNVEVRVKAPAEEDSETESGSNDSVQDFMREWEHLLPQPFGEDFQYHEYNLPEDLQPQAGEGSGFIFREDGYVLTNAHVVEAADEFIVHLSNGDEYEAELIGTDSFKDVAVLKINASDLPCAVLGDSDKTRVGEPVVAIGSPLGMQASVTAGILSTNKRSLNDLGQTDDVRRPQKFLQTDAAINRGNSGGPLLNAKGEVIGINQAIARYDWDYTSFDRIPIEGIGFAIPINEVKHSIEEIVEHGKVVYPGISATIASLSDYLIGEPGLKDHLKVEEGVYVVSVTIGGPAERGGIKAGDVILSINEIKVTTAKALIEQIQDYEVGDRVTLRVARQGGDKQEDVTVVLGELDISSIEISE